MDFLDNVNSLYTSGAYECLDGAPIKYIINEGSKDTYTIVNDYSRRRSTEIVDEGKFVNGFKVVKLDNNKYAYVREEDNKLMDYYFDIALNFNEYDMAMVGKNGSVVWINKDFKYLDYLGIRRDIKNIEYIVGWQKLYSFSKGEKPLAKMLDAKRYTTRIGYITTDMKLMEFKEFDGEVNYNNIFKIFDDGSSFVNDIAATRDKLLFAEGYFIEYANLIDYLGENGYLHDLSNSIKKMDNKTLKRVK